MECAHAYTVTFHNQSKNVDVKPYKITILVKNIEQYMVERHISVEEINSILFNSLNH